MGEGCALGDLVALGIRLTDAGLGDYGDDVDAVVRNHLVEQQLTRADLLRDISEASAALDPKDAPPYAHQAVYGDHVIQRSLGNFAGMSSPASIPNPWVMQCCTGNATQGLYYAWEATMREARGSAQVNLWLNRAARSLDVDSYLPYEGKVVLHNKTSRRVSVRIPSWVTRREIRAWVSGASRPLEWVGSYLLFDDLRAGDVVAIEFPLRETTARYTVNARTDMERTYTCAFRGSTCVGISPHDESPTSYPLYRRDPMRADKAPMKRAIRFAAERTILNW